MRNSKTLARIRAGKVARFVHLGYFIPPFVAYAAKAGYDGIWLDLEHHAMDTREIQTLLAFFHHYDIDCMLRPPTREKGQLYRYLEDGVTGFLFPHVSNANIARDLVSKVKFPPIGDRGIEGYGFETNFGLDIVESTRELVEHANRETFVFVQIETPEGVANVDAIAAVPGVDGLYIGPYDLKTRMELLPPDQQVDFNDTVARVAAAARKYGKVWGSFTMLPEAAKAHIDQGAQIITLGADYQLLKNGLRQLGQEIDAMLGEGPRSID